MALPMKGALRAQLSEPYVGAEVWGTGIHPVHSVYGEGPPLRTSGRNGNVPTIAPQNASDDAGQAHAFYEFSGSDMLYLEQPAVTGEVYIDDRPPWNEPPPDYNTDMQGHPSWNVQQWVNEKFRARSSGAHRLNQKLVQNPPLENVTEGWTNKNHSGAVADSKPSDDKQIFMQTSMMQRYRARNNQHAVARGTDEPRTDIQSRVTPQKLKTYSGQEVDSNRYFDMEPYQQDQILRPFRYRTAGTGPSWYLLPNAMNVQSPIQRIPPPDPSIGVQDATASGTDYGYTGEDTFYA
jgi:hypothetical protein